MVLTHATRRRSEDGRGASACRILGPTAMKSKSESYLRELRQLDLLDTSYSQNERLPQTPSRGSN